MADYNEKAMTLHRELAGKIEVISKIEVDSIEALSTAYTPGVAEPCRMIEKNPDEAYALTARGNMVAVVSDGTAVLGLGDIGPLAAMPVMEGKCVLFKKFGGVNAFPICVDTKDVDEIVRIVKALEPTFAGINLEDISAPRCFEIENRLKKETNMAIFHDDQHGTAVVVMSGLINALKIVKKKMEDLKVVIIGAGAAGIAIALLMMKAGIKDIVLLARKGILCEGEEWMNPAQAEIAQITNPRRLMGDLAVAMKGADVFIGVSGPGVCSKENVASMNSDAIVFAMSNPIPEIFPDEALAAGAAVIGTGRSDFPNQINNVLAFPGIFRGALDVRATNINDDMKMAAAQALAGLVAEEELRPEYVIPRPFDPRVPEAVAVAVAQAAIDSGVATLKGPDIIDYVKERTRKLIKG